MIGSPLASTRLPSLTRAGLAAAAGCLAQQRAVLARAVGDRRHEGFAEHFVRDLAAERLEQRQFLGAGLPSAIMVGILEHRMRALVGAVHDALVGPFEIEGQDQRFAQRRFLNFRAAC